MKATLVLFLFLIVGCATNQNLAKLELGMNKEDVLANLGHPDSYRGSITNKYNQVIEVWEYGMRKPDPSDGTSMPVTYWMYFCNGKLVQWGEAGDWKREADRIYEIRFR